MSEKIEAGITAAASGKVALPVISGAWMASFSVSTLTQWFALVAAIFYAGVQAIALYRGWIALQKERADAED